MRTEHTTKWRRPVGFAAAVTVSLASLFAGVPVSAADPYDDDGGGSSYDGGGDSGGGGMDEPAGGGMQEPAGGGMEEPGGGGMEEPGGGMQEPAGGGMEEPGGVQEPGGGMQEPAGGMQEPGGGGMEEPGGGMQEPGGGGMQEPGGAQEPGGGGMQEPGGAQEPGGGMQEPGGGGMQQSPEEASMEIPTALDAPDADITTASSSSATEVSTSSSSQEISSYQESLTSTVSTSTLGTAMTLSSPVALWNSGWLSYDRYYRPIFTNPYRDPLQVIYDYGSGPQTFMVPPLQRAVIDVPQSGVYSFTAATKPASGPPTNVSVGSFSGGGFQPAAGQAPPQKPPHLNAIKNALVQVKFDRGASEPFRVKTLTDLGKDPAVNNTTKVLLDQEIPAWGEWSKTPKGEALFVVNETQLMPGVSPPAQDPLPGYNVKLAASQQPDSWIGRHSTTLVVVAVGAAVLALVAVGLIVVTRRRRPANYNEEHHV